MSLKLIEHLLTPKIGLTYEQAADLLANTTKENYRKLGNNTYLRAADNGIIEVVLHRSVIVSIAPSGLYTLDSGGYRTATTRGHLCALTPVLVFQKEQDWYVSKKGETTRTLFREGMQVNQDGQVIMPA